MVVKPPPVKQLAMTHGLPVLQPERLRDPAFQTALRELAPDLIVVAAYGKILPPTVLALPPHGCINVHASLLPRHRGAAPVQWAILRGDPVTGVTIMQMNEGMDTGDILLQRETPIRVDDTAGTLTDRLASIGADALIEALELLHRDQLPASPQPNDGVTLAPRIERDQGKIDWQKGASELAHLVRAFAPSPGAFTMLGNRRLRVHRADVHQSRVTARPGTVLPWGDDAVAVATGDGMLLLRDVQLEGRRRLTAAEFLAGHQLAPGTCLGA